MNAFSGMQAVIVGRVRELVVELNGSETYEFRKPLRAKPARERPVTRLAEKRHTRGSARRRWPEVRFWEMRSGLLPGLAPSAGPFSPGTSFRDRRVTGGIPIVGWKGYPHQK